MGRWARIRRSLAFSWVGLALVGLYGLLTVFLVVEGLRDSDPKGSFVLVQLPVALALEAFQALGLLRLIDPLPGPLAYLAMLLPTLLAVYAAGWLAGGATSLMWSIVRPSIAGRHEGSQGHA